MIDSAEILEALNQLMWPFIRISAMIMTTSIFGSRTIPSKVKIMLFVLVDGWALVIGSLANSFVP